MTKMNGYVLFKTFEKLDFEVGMYKFLVKINFLNFVTYNLVKSVVFI